MRYVQLVLTESQVSLIAGAVGNARLEAEGVEREQLGQLTDFFYAIEASPERFPVRSKDMARALKKRVARMKGPAQPPRPNARKRMQARKESFQKRTAMEKRIQVSLFNSLRLENMNTALMNAAEVQAREERERIAATGLILPGQG